MTATQSMGKRLLVFVLACTFPCTGIPARGETRADRASVVQVSEGISRFGWELYRRLAAEKKGKNLCFSPASISTALAMTYAGARGGTARQMAAVLHYEVAAGKLHRAFRALMEPWNAPGGKGGSRPYELAVVNRLWGQKGYRWREEFLDVTRTFYRAPLEEVDFVGAAEKARVRINRWVERRTAGKIKDLIPRRVLNSLTRLVLTNAVYFNGTWEHPFEKQWTRPGEFRCAGGRKVRVPFMHRTERFRYAETEEVQVLEMPYKGRELAMVVVLPRKGKRLEEVEREYDAAKMQEVLGKLRPARVRVSMPRFRVTCTFGLREALGALGMKDAFVFGKADFSGMNGVKSGPERLYISAVIHKAFVDVNEEGTEAAAATAVVMTREAEALSFDHPKIFTADRPFLFLIRDLRNGTVLFMGRVVEPGK